MHRRTLPSFLILRPCVPPSLRASVPVFLDPPSFILSPLPPVLRPRCTESAARRKIFGPHKCSRGAPIWASSPCRASARTTRRLLRDSSFILSPIRPRAAPAVRRKRSARWYKSGSEYLQGVEGAAILRFCEARAWLSWIDECGKAGSWAGAALARLATYADLFLDFS